jgi:PTS system cellobiose-specific IIB component
MRRVLVLCGAGASSTFLATAMRARAAERQIDLRIDPVGESQLRDRLHDADALLVGAHLAARFDALRADASRHGVVAVLLASGHTGRAGAESALASALEALAETFVPSETSGASRVSLARHDSEPTRTE